MVFADSKDVQSRTCSAKHVFKMNVPVTWTSFTVTPSNFSSLFLIIPSTGSGTKGPCGFTFDNHLKSRLHV